VVVADHSECEKRYAELMEVVESLRAEGTPKPRTGPTGRRRGGQPGHEPSRREFLPPECVDHFEDHWPAICEECEAPLPSELRSEVGEPIRHQVVALPRVQAR
jgi:transposase